MYVPVLKVSDLKESQGDIALGGRTTFMVKVFHNNNNIIISCSGELVHDIFVIAVAPHT
jgi:hypothetical protein